MIHSTKEIRIIVHRKKTIIVTQIIIFQADKQDLCLINQILTAMKSVLVLGSNFGGFTASMELKRRLGADVEVTVVSPTDKFLYVPSLIWVPFGRRNVQDISIPVGPVLAKRGIRLVKDLAIKILPDQNCVVTEKHGELRYDYLVISTGIKMDFGVVDHLHPSEGLIQNIVMPPYAEKAFQRFEELVRDPGPVVVGATQGASCMGAAYEYLFNLEKTLRQRGVRDKVQITWITPEPYLGHFGIGGIAGGQTMLETFMKMFDIRWVTDASIREVTADQIILQDGQVLPYKMAMLMPPFAGAEVIKNSPELSDAKGFVECDDTYRHVRYPNVYAAGLAVQVKADFNCKVPFGVPKTGYPTDVSAKVVAENIVHAIKGDGKAVHKPWGKIAGLCVMDAGYKEVLIVSDHLFKPRTFAVMLPNVLSDWTKVLLEKYFLFKVRHGLSYLP